MPLVEKVLAFLPKEDLPLTAATEVTVGTGFYLLVAANPVVAGVFGLVVAGGGRLGMAAAREFLKEAKAADAAGVE